MNVSRKNQKIQGCIATADRPWLLLLNSVCEINKHPLSSTPTLFSASLSNSLLPFHAIILFSGARSSHQLWWGLHGGLSLIDGELKEAGWLRQPSITSLLPHFSLPTSPTEYRLSGLHLAAPRWRVFCSPCAPVICPSPRPASSLKDYILGRDLNYIACPHAPSTRLIILVLWDENLELLFSSYHSRHLQVLSVDKRPISLHDCERRGNKTTGFVSVTNGKQKSFESCIIRKYSNSLKTYHHAISC